MRETKRNRDEETKCGGFSLAEMLIVIALIVLMVAMAVPAFNFISGGRSVEGAQNQIAAMLGRARAEAIGLQETRGVFFFIDPATDRINMAVVHGVSIDSAAIPSGTSVDVWLDLVDDAEFISLPKGVGLQVVDDSQFNTSAPFNRIDDGYVGFNTANLGNGMQEPTRAPYGGVILFDGSGRLVSRRYAFKTYYTDATGDKPTQMGNLIYNPPGVVNPIINHYQQTGAGAIHQCVPIIYAASGTPPTYSPRSQFGFVLFDLGTFRDLFPAANQNLPERDWQFYPTGAPQRPGSYVGSEEAKEETWLDENSTPLLVNRYNGTLVKGE